MAYQENTALSPEDIINKIAVFAGANGWTVEQNVLSGSNRTATLRRAGTDYVTLWNTDTSNVRIRGHIGYTAGQNGDNQPSNGFRAAVANFLVAGPYARLYLFADAVPSPHIYAVIETAAGLYRKVGFGLIEKIGAYTGGTFFDAGFWTTSTLGAYNFNSRNADLFCMRDNSLLTSAGAVRVDIPADGRTDAWASLYVPDSYDLRTGISNADQDGNNPLGVSNLATLYYSRNNPTFSGTIALGAIAAEVQRPSSFWSKIGVFPGVRYLSMARFNPADEIAIGSDVWKVFPFVRKGAGVSGTAEQYSDDHALAIRRVD